MTDGPGSVSTLILVVVRSTEEGRGELSFPELNVDRVENEGTGRTADARAAMMRVRTAEVHING